MHTKDHSVSGKVVYSHVTLERIWSLIFAADYTLQSNLISSYIQQGKVENALVLL